MLLGSWLLHLLLLRSGRLLLLLVILWVLRRGTSMLAAVLVLWVLGRRPSVLCAGLRLLQLLHLSLLHVCEELIREALELQLVDFAHADSEDAKHGTMV